jgi:hypothetical protein
LGVALLGVAAVSGSPALAAGPTVVVAGDSVLVTGQSFGSTTVRATRPDAVTGAPVVIGQYAGSASAFGPFSVNTTVPTPLAPNGDCWQKGALASAVTPDLRAGDKVTVTQAGLFRGGSSTSVAVTDKAVSGAVGPIPACTQIAPWARNAVTAQPDSVTGGPIKISGVAQPFAKGVSVSATDGSTSTASVAATPAQDGTWSATIPAREVDRLASGTVTVSPVFEVPDVSTGASAHLAGAPVKVGLSKSAGGGSGSGSNSGSGSSKNSQGRTPAKRSGVVRVRSLRGSTRISLADARRNGIGASFVVPTGSRVVRVKLGRNGRTLMQSDVRAGRPGARQAVRLSGPRLRRVLQRGGFRLAVSAGPSRGQLGPAASRVIVVR